MRQACTLYNQSKGRSYKTCQTCHLVFNPSNPRHTQCRQCYSKTNRKTCPICEVTHLGQNERCRSCINKTERKCPACTKLFWGHSRDMMCRSCYQKRDRLFNHNLRPEEVREGFLMKITYLVENHDGSNPEIKSKKEIVEFPLLREFKNINLDRSGNVISGPLWYYDKSLIGDSGQDKHHYRIKSAKVIESKTKIDLGE